MNSRSRGTRAVFGDHISVYDIQRAVEDGATVPIYYESRLAKLALDERERPTIDAGFEEVTEGEEVDRREKLKTKWAADPPGWQPHIRNKPQREALAKRFRDPRRPPPDRAGARHVAHRLRLAQPAHDVRSAARG